MEIFFTIFGVLAFILLYMRINALGKEKDTVQKELSQMRTLLDTKLYQQTNTIDTRIQASTNNMLELTRTMAEVKESNKKIHELGKDIASLSDILKSPKLRGNLGEYLLEEVLKNYLHPEQFSLQYGFKSGEKVDACIHLSGSHILSIDSKFPLENFQKYLNADESDKDAYYRQFLRDVKKHIDAISTKYILPQEQTFDFALMYIPAESIYYDLMVSGQESELTTYAFSKKVIPVSPSTLFTYVQILLLGFKGLKIEENAEKILRNISQLQKYIENMSIEFDKLGKHLGNAQGSYQATTKALSRVTLVSDAMEKEIEEEKPELELPAARKENIQVEIL
ncbi:MAG: DNA recombination protein RmuC [Candidatus Gracilibacteria bacterium]